MFIKRKNSLRIPVTCYYPTSRKASATGYELNQISSILEEEQGFGEFKTHVRLYTDKTFSKEMSSIDGTHEVAKQDRVYVEVSVNTDDDRLSVFAENCSVTPTTEKNDPRRYFLIKRG